MCSWNQRWTGRHDEFYRESARLVEPLTWMEVREIGGAEVSLVAGQLRAAYGALQTEDAPRYLRLGPVGTVARDNGDVALTGYSPNDLVVLSSSLAEALHFFDGRRPTDEVCEQIVSRGIPLDRATLRRLVDFGVLQVAPTANSGRNQ
jgi:hypothetical protein